MPQLTISGSLSNATENEVHRLRELLCRLTEEARLSEEASKRCHEREIALLAAKDLPELLATLTEGLRQSFRLPCISLVLYDPDHVLRHLLASTGHPPEDYRDVAFVDRLQRFSPLYRNLSQPWLGPFNESDHQPLFPGYSMLRSIALLPLIRQGALIGSLNLGSGDPTRFTSNHASDFLNRLASIGAVCLENTTYREHLVVSGLTDALTGLHNRRYLDRRLAEETSRAQRYRQPLSCLFIDADHFKRINDLYGHSSGDKVLQELSLRVRECLRNSDIAARYGGEEFALLLPQTNLREAIRLAERIRSRVAEQTMHLGDGKTLSVTVSIGVSELREPVAADGQELLTTADLALYEAKHQGRNRVSSYPTGD
ncbi:MAG: sensor domain-containing diguanylate cyclase [Gammaproteobacteria bacterium]|nr:sensor domain-containing diguanylate cyclase [Gammaproteobacteria bacterium]